MPQNLITLNLTDADHAEIADLLTKLEAKFGGLISLSIADRRSISKMGDKSEMFCRRTLVMMNENPNMMPADVSVADAIGDLSQVDALRPHIARLRKLLGRAEDSEMALGSDAMVTALDGYALLKVLGKGSGLDAMRRDMGNRFARKTRTPEDPVPVA